MSEQSLLSVSGGVSPFSSIVSPPLLSAAACCNSWSRSEPADRMRVAQRILILSAAFAVLSTPVASYLTHVPALLRAGESTLQITADRRQTSECSSPRWTAALESRRGIMCRAGQGLFAALVYRPRRAGALGLQAKDDGSLFDRAYDAVGRSTASALP